jgi:penicillin-binding protein 1A
MQAALANVPFSKFHIPEGMTEYRIGLHTGMSTSADGQYGVTEAFKPGTGPSAAFAAIDDKGSQSEISPMAKRALQSGSVGLY